MKQIFLCLLLSMTILGNAYSQKEIRYHFEREIIDSLKSGVELYERLNPTFTKSALKYFIIVVKTEDQLELFLNEYSSLGEVGILEAVQTSNRKVFLNDSLLIPVLVQEDVFSKSFINSGVKTLPRAGYYIIAKREKNKWIISKSEFLF